MSSHSHPHDHAQSHDPHHGHHHHGAPESGKVLLFALVLTLGFAGIEAVGGWLANSLALMGDAGHMVSDAFALGLAAFAAWLAKRPPTLKHSYGLLRVEILAALFNSLFMLVVVGGIVYAAIGRLAAPAPVQGGTVMLLAAIGLVVNIAVAFVLMRGEDNINVRGALLHVMGDLLGSVAALVSGAVIYYTAWATIDPILSILICVLILVSSLKLLRDVINMILDAVPRHIDMEEVGTRLAATDGVLSVHDLHIWALSSGTIAVSAHVVVRELNDWPAVHERMSQTLNERFDIQHITLQPELGTQVIRPIADLTV